MKVRTLLYCLLTLSVVPCAKGEKPMKLLSSAFSDQESIPAQYTVQGEGISPPLRWQDMPEGTRSLALVCEDPDAPHGTYDHWILYNIPPTVGVLAEGLKDLPHDIQSIKNSAGTMGYYGPNPPSGTHRYFFILYALDTVLGLLPEGATKADLLKAMNSHILAQATLVGNYHK
jgi:Raf kinase inhibitor-like YbhB/YbcL family protein